MLRMIRLFFLQQTKANRSSQLVNAAEEGVPSSFISPWNFPSKLNSWSVWFPEPAKAIVTVLSLIALLLIHSNCPGLFLVDPNLKANSYWWWWLFTTQGYQSADLWQSLVLQLYRAYHIVVLTDRLCPHHLVDNLAKLLLVPSNNSKIWLCSFLSWSSAKHIEGSVFVTITRSKIGVFFFFQWNNNMAVTYKDQVFLHFLVRQNDREGRDLFD